MNTEEKTKFLQNFCEKELTQKILMPLFESMGFEGIRYTHGVLEDGKDIIYYARDAFGNKEYTAVVVKATGISKTKAREAAFQIREAFTRPFIDLLDNKEKKVHRVLLLTSRKINEHAKKYISDEFKNDPIGKFLHCAEVTDLITLLEKYMPKTFWDEYDYFKRYFVTIKKYFESIHDVVPLGLREKMSFERMYVPIFLTERVSRIESGASLFMVPIEENISERFTERIYEVPEIIDKFKNLLIVGFPGSGKTTLLRYICIRCCKRNIDTGEREITPIFFTLNELNQSRQSLREYIETVLERYNFPEAKEYIEEDLKNGKCIILMDGFDELPTNERKEQIRETIYEFIKRYQENRIIITSRILGYYGQFPEFTQMKVIEFNDSQIKMFIEKWFQSAEKTKHIIERLQSNDRIYALARNPLMMTMIALIYEEDKELPQRRVDLYRRCIELLLSRWVRIKGTTSKFSAEDKEFILRKLALNFQIERRTLCSRAEILSKIAEYFPRLGLNSSQVNEFLDELCYLNGILRQESPESYDFLHLSFQEYLAALEIEKSKKYDLLVEYLSDNWWEETIRLTAGINGDGTELIGRILEQPQDGSYTNVLLAGKCIADTIGTDLELKKGIIQQLENIFDTLNQPFILDEIMYVLVEIGSIDVQNFFINCLAHPDAVIREASINALALLDVKRALPWLIEMAKKDPEWSIRCYSIDALISLSDRDIFHDITDILSNDPEPRVREYSIRALEALEIKKAVPILREVLFGDSDPGVRIAAAKTMYNFGTDDAFSIFSQAYENEKESIVKKIIFDILESLSNH